jgi:tRNA-2-methylthio-N6-dimethylallyladenosine synthase
MLFSFIFSPRRGTPAFDMPDPSTYEEKLVNFNRLLKAQEEISARNNQTLVGRTLRVLCTGRDEKNHELLSGRTESNKLVFFPGSDDRIGTFCDIKITQAKTWFLFGEEME